MSIVNKIKTIALDFADSKKIYGFKNTVLALIDDLFDKHTRFLLSPIDFMIPMNGKLTAGQLLIISRILDYELVTEGKKTVWEQRFSELEGGAVCQDENYFKNIIDSLNKWGWDYNLSSVFINKVPSYAYNGTHRMAYALKHNPYQVIPFTAHYNGWPWSKMTGLDYWKKRGLKEEEYNILIDKYDKLMSEIDTSFYVVLQGDNKNVKVMDNSIEVKEVFDATVIKEVGINPGISRQLFSLFHKQVNKKYTIIKCSTNNHYIKIHKREIIAPYLESYTKLNKGVYYTPTITEANEFRLLLNSLCSVKFE